MFKSLKLNPADVKNIDDLQKLPILTKEDIRNNLGNLTAKNYSKRELMLSATGGSTGEPMSFFINKEWGAWNMAAAYREWSWAGYKPGDKIAYLWGAPQDLSHQGELKNKMFNLINRTIMLDAFDMTKKTLDEYVRMLRKFKPKVINAYVSAVYLMAQYMENRGINDIKPKAILTSCEMLFDYQRETIERVFGCEVFDYYSGRDTTIHAGECPEHSGYHLAIENAVVEFIRDDEHVESGEMGKIIITDLSNYAMPLIRYEIGDLGVPSDEICSCGRGLPLMKKVVGRVTDIITTKDDKYVHGEFFTHLFYDTRGIKQFQFIQKTKEYAILKIVKKINYSQAELDKIINQIYEQCGDIRIDVEFVESIPLTSSGKYRFTISEVGMRYEA
jgi:phenylacetate-CoA ligase